MSRVFIFGTSVKYRLAMAKLNPEQYQAITETGRNLLVLAGAGSGKTRVITEKIAHLVNHCAMPPENIIAVTFTNKAAQEMRKRIAGSIGSAQANKISVSTFHTLGLKILRLEHEIVGYKPGFTIFNGDDVVAIIQQLFKEGSEGYSGDERMAAWQISQFKNSLLSPEDALHTAGTGQEMALAKLYERYRLQLKAYNAVDFDDLIMLPTQILQTSAETRQRWQAQVHHLLIDEYQDTNASQYKCLSLLLGEHSRFTAVGDDDQSIYAWRGAQPENLNKLMVDFPDLQLIKLEQNYRSMLRILNCANQLIANNPHYFEKRLWSRLGPGDLINIIPCDSPENEAESIVSEIMHRKFQGSCPHSDFAILYRSNHQSRLFESVLRLHNLRYKVSGGTAFFDRSEIKDLLAYLRIIVNPEDDAAFLRIINTPRREIGANTLEKLGKFAAMHELSLLPAISHSGFPQALPAAARTRLTRFADWINELSISSRDLDAGQMLNKVIDDINYSEWLLLTSKDKNLAEARTKNVSDLQDWVKKLCKRQENTLSLEALIDKLALMDIIERNEDKSDADAIQLMTLHAAKGLEFKHVFIVGFEEGLLPHHSSDTDEAIHEERRLAYVGITRAQRSLTISFAERRQRNGETIRCQPSRFLNELPKDDVQWSGSENLSTDEKLARGNTNISSLRKLLGNI